MSEHWKSTPKYYCKHCLTYVRDTKLERTNHEATGKHQGAVRRALTNLHRAANNEARERDRAKREIDRLNGVVSNRAPRDQNAGGGASGAAAGAGGGGKQDPEERRRQAEQLTALGVTLPQEFRGELAMPGEWSVTSTRVVDEEEEEEEEEDKTKAGDEDRQARVKARGVHKRERTEEQLEHEEAVNGLFKKPRRWGRDARGRAEESEDLDALLSGGLVVKKKDEEEMKLKNEPEEGGVQEEDDLKTVKEEPQAEADPIPADITAQKGKEATFPRVDRADITAEDGDKPPEAADVPVAVFKKRKVKNIRQK